MNTGFTPVHNGVCRNRSHVMTRTTLERPWTRSDAKWLANVCAHLTRIRLANAFSLNIEGMTPHPETCAENPGGLLDIQEANWKAAFVEPLSRAGRLRAPAEFTQPGRSVEGAPSCIAASMQGADPPMTEDGRRDFIRGDDGLVRDPFVWCFRIERAQARAVGHDRPRALRRFAARFPAEHNLAGLEIHAAQTRRAGAHVSRAEARFDLGAWSQVLPNIIARDPEAGEALVGIEAHVTAGNHVCRNRSANAFVIGSGLHGPSLAVGKKFGQINLDNLDAAAESAALAHD